MSFLSRLGLQSVCEVEGNHGELEDFDTTSKVLPPLGNLQIPDITYTKDADTPATARPDLVFGANTFGDKRIVISKGFYITIDRNNSSVFNLFLMRTKDDDLRVAQIMAEYFTDFLDKSKKKMRTTKTHIIMHPGVHDIAPDVHGYYDAEYFFLSKLQF